jgi:NAD(P)-dependent dehydrogenase (short-subunit alcohol dehydrogenase family)
MKNTPFDLTGKVAVITGSSRGIGRSSAELLAKLGAKVVISSRKADACQEVAEGIKKGRRRRSCHPLQHLAPRGSRGADIGHDKALRQGRYPRLQRRGEPVLRAAARYQGRGLRQDHGQ